MQTKLQCIDHLLDITDKAVAAGSVFDIKHHSSLCKFKVKYYRHFLTKLWYFYYF